MTTNEMSDRELIERISLDVSDPELRLQLLKIVSERKNSEESNHILKSIGVKADAIPKNVTLMKRVNAILCLLFLIVGVVGLFFSQHIAVTIFSVVWTIMVPIIFFINNRFYNNIIIKRPLH